MRPKSQRSGGFVPRPFVKEGHSRRGANTMQTGIAEKLGGKDVQLSQTSSGCRWSSSTTTAQMA
jgi:hypothetical protein